MKEVITAETYQSLFARIGEFMESHDTYGHDNLTIVVERVAQGHEDERDYWWSATLVPKDAASALKDLLVDEHGYVGFFVSSEEVRDVATDMQRELTDEELADVVKYLSQNDLETGLCELAIEGAISEVCPDATDQEWDEEDDSGIEYLHSIGK